MTKNCKSMKRARRTSHCEQLLPVSCETTRNPLVRTRPTTTPLTTLILVSSLLLSQTSAFMVPRHAFAPRSTPLQSTRAASAESFSVQAVSPKRFTSMKERREAEKALNLQRAPANDKLIDAKMLELLSDQFLYPTKPKKTHSRPPGRPESVPGAMGYEAMLKNRQQEEEQALSTVIPYSSTSSVSPTFDPVEVVVTKRKKNGIRGLSSATNEQATKTRKKVVKNLPEKKIFSEKEMEKPKLIKQRRGRSDKSIDLQRYYRTELLTAKEEYSLGMQIHFMMKCEEVHEGLTTKLMRLPTVEEWAHACG